MFKRLQETADTLFVSMPAPVPSVRAAPSYSSYSYSSSSPAVHSYSPAPAAAPVQMDRYMDRYGGCLHPNGRVILRNGTTKLVKNLRQGDVLPSGACVRCNVQLSINAPLPMCRLPGGLLITPWHPVCMPGSDAWCFPAHLHTAEAVFVKNVYNLVLDSQHSLLVDGVACVTLGHGITHDDVRSHAFFGTSAVLDFLSQLPGWDAGLVRCSGVARRGCDGRVCGFEQDGQQVWREEEEHEINHDQAKVRDNAQFPVAAN